MKTVTRRGASKLLALSLGSLLLLLVIAGQLGTSLVMSRRLERVDALISLASHEWERLPLTARLAATYPDSVILLTQPQPATSFNCHDCNNRVDRLRHFGVNDARVHVLPIKGTGTHGEALAAREFAGGAGVRHLLVVTSPYHTRRALATFRKVFEGTAIEIGIEPAVDSSPARPACWWTGGYDRAYVSYEWAAIVYYTWRYGV